MCVAIPCGRCAVLFVCTLHLCAKVADCRPCLKAGQTGLPTSAAFSLTPALPPPPTLRLQVKEILGAEIRLSD